ncbi:MAG: hypothetical protein A2W61_00420 [Deltaproteobacteria bacterium RIFCSPLOWO2_01_44_7]|nr:MAG: hypothetical protein A2W61_00420 [Deltaproteobacteria bacterium RIFCSPLOWO2_01_44_7]
MKNSSVSPFSTNILIFWVNSGLACFKPRLIKKAFPFLKSFPKSIAILGVGKDKHTASLLEDWVPSKDEENLLVTQLKDFPGEFKERTTLTLFGLSMIDLLLVLVFGEDKKGVIKSPPSFFRRENISNKTLLITDQKL